MNTAPEPDWLALACWIAAVLALLPALMTAFNLPLFRRPRPKLPARPVSIIVPARNEEAEIEGCVRALLASTDVEAEIIVVDDHSTDRTAQLVRDLAAQDARVRLHAAPALPPGWSGKQHACHAGAAQARHPVLMFIDCDVRLAPAAVAAASGFLDASGAALVSGFPRELTRTPGEILLIPMIHVLLLGYLPMLAMRRSRLPALGAGCGQWMVADAAVYRRIGGHALISASWHDGLMLPRKFRQRGYRTDVFDAGVLAECRMYRGFAATWRGLSKNAREGMATQNALPVWTALLGGGLMAPFLLLPFAVAWMPQSAATLALGIAAAALLLARLAVAWRFRQTWWAVALLPVGAITLLALQWSALLAPAAGGAVQWRGRTQFSR